MPPSSTTLPATTRPTLRSFDRTVYGFRFRFDLGPKTLLIDTDEKGREFDSHLEWPPEFTVPPMARAAALEQIRKVLIIERAANG